MNINIKQIPKHTWVSIVMVILVVINHILIAMGKPVISLGEEQITVCVNTVIDIVTFTYVAWKNQSMTTFAQIADEVLYALRDGAITKEEVMEFILNHKTENK